MLHLDLEDIRAGMVIGQDVLGAKGQLLLCAGATLTGKHLEVLRANRVQELLIRPTTPTASAPRWTQLRSMHSSTSNSGSEMSVNH